MTQAEIDKAKADCRARARRRHWKQPTSYKANKADWLDGRWAGLKARRTARRSARGDTGVDVAELRDIGKKITTVPDGFRVHKTIQRFLENRAQAIETGKDIDWATGEALAFCTHPARRQPRAPVGTGFRARHLLAAPFGAVRSGRRKPLHAEQSSGAEPGRVSKSSTRCCRKRPCLASSTAIRWPSRMR